MNTSHYWLENDKGVRFDLSPDSSKCFMKNVEGLGIASSNAFAEVNDGFAIVSNSKTARQAVVTDIVFLSRAFETYRELVDYIYSATELFLVYNPYGSREYYLAIQVDSLTKARRDYSGAMVCNMQVTPLTFWSLPTPLQLQFEDDTETAFQYSVTPYGTAQYSKSLAGNYVAEIQPSGHFPAAIEFTFRGASINPVLKLVGENTGEVYGECRINYSFGSGDEYTLDTRYNDSSVSAIVGGERVDLLDYIDLTKDAFFRVPVTEPCLLSVEDDDALSGTAEVKVYYYYRSV